VGGLILLLLLRNKTGKGPVAAMLIFIGTLFPTLGFFNYGYLFHAYVADRFLYLPSLAILALAVGIGAFRMKKNVLCTLAIVFAIAFGFLTWRQQEIYKNLEVYARASVAGNPDCWAGLANIGFVLCKKGDHAKAIPYYQKAAQVNPRSGKIWTLMGDAYRNLGKLDQSLQAYNQALKINPNTADAVFGIGIIRVLQGNHQEAVIQYERAIRLAPNDLRAYRNLGEVYVLQGKNHNAVDIFQKALEIDPTFTPIMKNLAWLLATQNADFRNPKQAVILARRASRLTNFQDLGILYTLGVAYDANKQFQEAQKIFEKLKKLAESSGNQEYFKKASQRLDQDHGNTAKSARADSH